MAGGRMGGRIRARRLDLGLRQVELAARVGISAPYLNLIEHDRRRIGGRLLLDLARALAVEPATLAEGAGAGLVAALGTAGARLSAPAAGLAADLAARFPDWAGLIATQHRRIAELEETVESLSDRLANDPWLAAAMHEVLSAVTAIRATAAILNEGGLGREWLDRFHRNIDADARRLAASSRALVGYLEGDGGGGVPEGAMLSPAESFERWLAARVEAPAAGQGDALPEGAEARALAEAWLAQEAADVAAVPAPALAAGDPLAIAAAAGAPLAAVFRRLAALPGGNRGLVVADAAGAVLFRRPIAGFQMPRLGAACPLWPLFLALSRPMQPQAGRIEQAARLPRRFRYWAVAEPLAGSGLAGPPTFRALMLLAPDDGAPGPAEPVGTTCRVCPRAACPARREPSVLPG